MSPTVHLLRLSLKNAWRLRRRTLLVGCVIALGNAILIFQLAQGRGQEAAFLNSMIRSLSGHLQIQSRSAESSDVYEASDLDAAPLLEVELIERVLAETPGVAVSARRIRFGAMVAAGEESWGGFVLGVDPERERRVCDAVGIARGRFVRRGEDGIVIGGRLAEDRGLDLGDSLILLVSTVDGYFNGMEFRVVGILEDQGLSRFHSSLLYIPIDRAKRLIALEQGEAYELVVTLDEDRDTAAAAADIEARLSRLGLPVRVTTWQEMGATFRGILKVSQGFRVVMAGFLSIIVLMLIFNTLSVYVLDRTREVATMMAIGYSGAKIVLLFIAEGLFLASSSAAVGLAVGGGLSEWLGTVGIPAFNEAMTYVFAGDRLYPILRPEHVLALLGGTGAIGLVASLGPALRAARLDPAQTLNRE